MKLELTLAVFYVLTPNLIKIIKCIDKSKIGLKRRTTQKAQSKMHLDNK